jgi:hypothetical protein
MKRELTWKTIFVSIAGVTLLVVVATLAFTLAVGQGKTSTRTATPQVQVKTVPTSLLLCTVAKRVTTLAVRRGTFKNPTVFSFPAFVFVENVASARSVAKTICAIPTDMRTDTLPCPFDQGLTYRLVFTIPKYVIAPIILHLGGCGAVEGTGAKGWIHLTPKLFRVLGNAMRLHLATADTFFGKMR